MTRAETTEQIMTVVRDFNKRGEPIYLSKLMELITESSEPTVSKYVTELIEEGKLKAGWVHNFDRRGHTKVLYAYDYYGEDRTLDPQMERLITELHNVAKEQAKFNANIQKALNRGTVKPVGPVVIQHKEEPKTITVNTITKYLDKGEKE